MNLSDITTQPYILALFKRDDGQRFLLGSGAYEFKESQQHFVANAMVNDVVEVQGSDGALLAGQVRRASVQSFDGYIGDGGVIKSSVENYRKDFIAYFQKNHLYTVIYIFADGTAIQRKRGYIVDAPEVKELYQMTPEYHIAMNFEDVNYYKYAENSDGDEMYSNYVNVTSATTSSGGLIWDTGGNSSITAEGTQFNIYGTIAGTALDSFTLKGQTVQQTYTGKNLLNLATFVAGRIDNGVVGYASDTTSFNYTESSITFTTTKNYRGVASDFIEVSPSTQYVLNRPDNATNYMDFYTTSKTWISRATSNPFTTPANCGFVRVSYQGTTAGTFTVDYPQFEQGSTSTEFEPYVGGIASPNPDYPQTVQVVTGVQKITIGDGGENTDIFTVNLGSIELCKISDYQDYVYKSNGDWYVHKEFEKIDLGSLTWNTEASGTNYRLVCQTQYTNLQKPASNNSLPVAICSHYGIATAGDTYSGVQGLSMSQSNRFYIYDNNYNSSSSANAYNTWAQTNNPIAYWQLATPTDTQITDAFLISELDGLLQMAECYDGVTTFKNEAQAAGSVPGWMVVEVTTGSGGIIWDNIGATWEEGGEGGDTYVTVDSITNVFPTITINGPAYNPKITNVTTGQIIQYNGNVNGSQKLIIDIEQKTAKLSGTSVISNISGDWLYLTPGVNRLTYTIDNADKNYATIEWQEITG